MHYRVIRGVGATGAWEVRGDGAWVVEREQRGERQVWFWLKKLDEGLATEVWVRRGWWGWSWGWGRWGWRCEIGRGGEVVGRIRSGWLGVGARFDGEVPGADRLRVEVGGAGMYELARAGRGVGRIRLDSAGALVEVRPEEDQGLVLAVAVGLCSAGAGRVRACRLAKLEVGEVAEQAGAAR